MFKTGNQNVLPGEVLLRAVREEITKAGNEKKKEGKTTKSFTVNFFVYRIKMIIPLSVKNGISV